MSGTVYSTTQLLECGKFYLTRNLNEQQSCPLSLKLLADLKATYKSEYSAKREYYAKMWIEINGAEDRCFGIFQLLIGKDNFEKIPESEIRCSSTSGIDFFKLTSSFAVRWVDRSGANHLVVYKDRVQGRYWGGGIRSADVFWNKGSTNAFWFDGSTDVFQRFYRTRRFFHSCSRRYCLETVQLETFTDLVKLGEKLSRFPNAFDPKLQIDSEDKLDMAIEGCSLAAIASPFGKLTQDEVIDIMSYPSFTDCPRQQEHFKRRYADITNRTDCDHYYEYLHREVGHFGVAKFILGGDEVYDSIPQIDVPSCPNMDSYLKNCLASMTGCIAVISTFYGKHFIIKYDQNRGVAWFEGVYQLTDIYLNNNNERRHSCKCEDSHLEKTQLRDYEDLKLVGDAVKESNRGKEAFTVLQKNLGFAEPLANLCANYLYLPATIRDLHRQHNLTS